MAQNYFLFCRSSSPQEKDKKVNGEPEEESCQQSFLSFLNLKPGKFNYFLPAHPAYCTHKLVFGMYIFNFDGSQDAMIL